VKLIIFSLWGNQIDCIKAIGFINPPENYGDMKASQSSSNIRLSRY
tara:strand:- start:59 stop:196 length:138 start_codon:yes stop_codon:yes gene_type:complete